MDEALEEIRRTISVARRFAKKGAYLWALFRAGQAATMAQMLAKMHLRGQISMTQQEIAELQRLADEVQALTDSIRLLLGNGHKRMEGARDETLVEIAETIIAELDEVFADWS